jgi:hypothetical protein
LELPSLWLRVNLFKASFESLVPIAVVDTVAEELGMQQVEPSHVHVHYESLEGADLGGIVVQADGKACLLYACVERCLPTRRSRHGVTLRWRSDGTGQRQPKCGIAALS